MRKEAHFQAPREYNEIMWAYNIISDNSEQTMAIKA